MRKTEMFFFGETTQRWDILSLIESLQFNYSIKCNVSSVGISSLNRQRETMFPSYEGPTQGLLYYPYRQYTNLFIFRFASQNTPYTLRLLRLNYPSTSHPLYINKYFDIIRSIYKQISPWQLGLTHAFELLFMKQHYDTPVQCLHQRRLLS